jgi:hypothetical protein
MLIRISHARHFFILSAWSLLSLAAGFRFLGQDKDYLSYVDFYDKLNASLITSLSETRFEPGFVFLGWASKFLLHFDFSLFLLLSASIALSIKIYLLSLRKFTWILLVFYVLILYPLHDMTQIRAAIAMAMTYLAFDFLIKRKWHHAIPLFALGVLFHYSVLIFSPFLLIPLKWLVKQNIASSRSTFWLLILSSSTLLLVFFDPSLFFRVSSSLNPMPLS